MLKIVLFYNQTNRGWTETWYANGDEPPLKLTTQLNNIFSRAIAFRHPLTTLEWARFSVVGRPQRVNSFRLSNKVASQADADPGPDVVQTDALWKLITANFARRTISLRGLNDASVARNPVSGAFEPTPFLLTGVNNYLTAVYNAGWQIRATKNNTNTPGYPIALVSSIEVAPGTTDRCNIFAPLGTPPVVGQKLRFFGNIDGRKLPYFPRTPTIVARETPPSATMFQIQYPFTGNTYFPTGMKVSALQYEYESINDWDFQALSKRDTGRPFGSSRGRRSAAGSRR